MSSRPFGALLAGVAAVGFLLAGCSSADQLLFSEGEAQLQRHAYLEAYETFTRYLALNPRSPAGFYNRGIAATGMGRFYEAVADFDRAIEIDPNDIYARWMRYDIRSQHRRELREASARLSPLLRPLEQTLQSAETALLLQELDMILRIDPSDNAARCERGTLLKTIGRITEAKSDLDIALRNNPDDIWARNERGRLMHDLGDYEAAIEDYEAALASCDTCNWLFYNKALSLMESGRSRDAAEVLRGLVTADSLDAGAWFMLGDCDVLLGRTEDACAAFSRSMKLGMTEAQARFQELCR